MCLNRSVVDVNGSGGEFDADCAFGFQIEFVSGETGEEVGFADAGVADEDDFEEVVVFVVATGHVYFLVILVFL